MSSFDEIIDTTMDGPDALISSGTKEQIVEIVKSLREDDGIRVRVGKTSQMMTPASYLQYAKR